MAACRAKHQEATEDSIDASVLASGNWPLSWSTSAHFIFSPHRPMELVGSRQAAEATTALLLCCSCVAVHGSRPTAEALQAGDAPRGTHDAQLAVLSSSRLSTAALLAICGCLSLLSGSRPTAEAPVERGYSTIAWLICGSGPTTEAPRGRGWSKIAELICGSGPMAEAPLDKGCSTKV